MLKAYTFAPKQQSKICAFQAPFGGKNLESSAVQSLSNPSCCSNSILPNIYAFTPLDILNFILGKIQIDHLFH